MGGTLKKGGELFDQVKAFFFDLDGCIYFTDTLAPSAGKLIERLKQEGKKVGFITNNSRLTAREVEMKLHKMGLEIPSEDIFTATDLTGLYIKNKYGNKRVKSVGSDGLNAALASAGHELLPLDSEKESDVVVVGRDITFSYATLEKVAGEVDRGAILIGANADGYHPGSNGKRVPETGALIAAIESVTGRKAEYVGKPESNLFLYGMQAFGCSEKESVMIGDNYYTDIIGGKHAGMHTVWIRLENETMPRRAESAVNAWPMADYVYATIAELLESCNL
ncbi:HAD-IIA family hydrolase [Paenibacillus lignilyticus]|uniref:HAD-IIA family hydrolase n=1 Tax=Paenibacillus lignilyticus TaxID=1172615 RepID=A0ABS5C987_9BACL|nr:HAD-IIA family hydrolase [Paenibacillus lignilyticus]MBP3962564.1 HAD-IIA family hydrolase [Paenibacillus lignilyticus]